MRKTLALVSLLLVAACGCARRGFHPFPSAQEAPGWTKGRVRSFQAARLWEYVDGDAERYLEAGVESTYTAEYRYQAGAEAVVDVHLMRDAAGARRIFESEPETGSRPVNVGEAGRHYGPSLTFRRGRCFVRLVAYEDSPAMRAALTALAAALDRHLRSAAP